ncbi:hypothetical protein HYR99_42095 [Candidatus Poribacteria bacterium]|nr:hypothetical protein [Candidatus Poribacteria bacterium]
MTVHEVLTKWGESEKDFLAGIRQSSSNAEIIFSQLYAVFSELKEEIPKVCNEYDVNKPDITLVKLQKDQFFLRQHLIIGEINWLFDYNLLPSRLEEGHPCRKSIGENNKVNGLFVWCWREGDESALVRADAYIRTDSQWTSRVNEKEFDGLHSLDPDSARIFIIRVIRVGLQPLNLFWYDLRERCKNGIPVAELTKETEKSLPYMPSPRGMYL